VMVQFSSSGDPRFVFLDCGLVFRTKSEEAHQALIDICIAFMKHDGLSAGRLMVNKHLDEAEKLKLAAMTPDQRETYDKQQQKRSDEFCKGLQTMIDETEHVKFFEHFGQYVNRICDLAREYRVKLDPDYFHVAMVT
jgi:predicted unusual protein kinase regulating ubiquinone biosynthesis (AarF/ABC1/UbiB family)